MTITVIYNPDDTCLVESDKSDNSGIHDAIYVGRYEEDLDQYNARGLIKFDLSSLPPDIVINSAIVSMYCHAQQSYQDFYVTFYRSLVQWFEGEEDFDPPGYNDDGSTYNRRNENDSARLNWIDGYGSGGGSGDDWDATMTSQDFITRSGEWYEWDVEADIQDFVDGVHDNHGWFIIGDEGDDDTSKSFRSQQYYSSSYRPFLTIDHEPATPPVPAGVEGCCVPKDERGP